MSDFTICPDRIRSVQENVNALSRRVDQLAYEAENLSKQTRMTGGAMNTVRSSLYALSTTIQNHNSRITRLGTILGEAVRLYESCEQKVLDLHTAAHRSNTDPGTVVEVPVTPLGAQSKLTAKSKVYTATTGFQKTSTLFEKVSEKTYEELGFGFQKELTLTEMAKESKKTGGSSKKKSKKSSASKDDLTVGLVGTSGGASVSLWEKGEEYKYGSLSAEALTAEVHGSASAGLYAREKEGKLVADPCVQASAGASVCLLSGEASASIGSSKAGLAGEASASVGKAEAAVIADAGLRDKEGNLNPHLSGSASAEATAAEASVSAKASLLGVDAKVKAGAKVGVGAHADFAIGDGRIKAEVGAALGLGFDAGFEVDVSGAVKTICDCAETIIDFAGSLLP